MIIKAVFAAAALLTAVPAFAQSPHLVAAAKREEQVVVFSGYVGAPSNKAIAAAFDKKYGVKVETLEFRGIESRERERVEQAAGRNTVDIMHNPVQQLTLMRDVDKPVQPYGSLVNVGRLKDEFKATEHFTPIFTINYGILVNTNQIKPADGPKNWKHLRQAK